MRIDQTANLLAECNGTWGVSNYAFTGKPATKKLSAIQSKMLDRFDGYRLGLVSKALRYAKPIRSLAKREHRALISLLAGRVLRIYRIPGSLISAETDREVLPSECGANCQHHYLLQKV